MRKSRVNTKILTVPANARSPFSARNCRMYLFLALSIAHMNVAEDERANDKGSYLSFVL